MSNTNSVLPFLGGSPKEVADAIGITQFPGEHTWFQVIGGVIIQGGYETLLSSSSNIVTFVAPLPKQVLGIFIQAVGAAENGAYIDNIDLEQFELFNGAGDRFYYWWAIGV